MNISGVTYADRINTMISREAEAKKAGETLTEEEKNNTDEI